MFENETKKRNEKAYTTSKKSKKTQHKINLKSKIRQKRKQIFFLLLTEKRKNIDIETLKRLTIIVTKLTKLYLSTNNIAEFINELNKAKRRILSQISETFTKLFKYREILFLVKNFHFHDKKNSDKIDFNLFFED